MNMLATAAAAAAPAAPPAPTQVTPPAIPAGPRTEPSIAPTVQFTPPAPQVPVPPVTQVATPPGPAYDPAVYGEVDVKTGRPANVPSKYWDYEKREVKWPAVLEQHNWLQKKLGDKKEKPPEAYAITSDADFTAPEGLDKDPVYLGLSKFAHDQLELSQAQWDGLIRQYWTLMAGSGEEITQANIASIGLDRINNIGQFIAANAPPELYQKAATINEPAAIEVIEWAIKERLPPALERGGGQDTGDSADSLAQLQLAVDEYGQRKMANPEYAADVRRRLAAVTARRR